MAVFQRKYRDATGKLVKTPHWTIEFTLLGEYVKENSAMASKKEAKALEVQLRQGIADRRKAGKQKSIPLGTACRRYYETMLETPGAKEPKLYRDRIYLKQIVDEFGDNTLLADIPMDRVAKWRDGLIGEGLKSSSVNRLTGLLRAIMNRARTDWHVGAPVWEVKQFREPADRIRYLDDPNEAALLKALPAHARDFVTFLLDSGCRKGEAENLTWDRLMWDRPANWEHDRATVTLYATDTKSKKARRVPLSKRTSLILLGLRERYRDHPRVFMYERAGVTRSIGNIRKPFDTAMRRSRIKPCGGDGFVVHDARHHYASRLAQKGMPLKRIQELLGHASIVTTSRYAHLCPITVDEMALLD